MGRELQKKKNRSSIQKSRPKLNNRTKAGKKKVNFLGSETIAKNWDRKLTLSQNYEQLGLSTRLAAASGGVEKRGKENKHNAIGDSLSILKSRTTDELIPEEVAVERDPETGRILRVLRPEPAEETLNPLNDPLNDLSEVKREAAKTDVVAKLEQEAVQEEEMLARKKRPRQQSQREEEWIVSLIQKHGQDIKAMSRDKKLNPMQQTEGDIGRRLRKWRERNQATD